MKRYGQYLAPALCLAIALAAWELCVQALDISPYVLPAPSSIASALVSESADLWTHSLVTLGEATAGLAIATALAILIAILMDVSGVFRTCAFPYLVVSQTVPVIVLGPLFTIWLGFGMAPKILMVVFMCFFPIAISFADALRQTDQRQMNLLKSFGASTLQQYLMVKIPGAATALFSGLKMAATYCMGGAIVGEWLSASAGLGYYMIQVKNGFMMDKVFACVIAIIFWSLVLNLAVNVLERALFPHLRKHKNATDKKAN